MRKVIFSSLFLLFILMGCSNEAYHNAIQKGLDYIASDDLEKAEAAFELALEEKRNDERAIALLEQVQNYHEASIALEEGELELSVETAEKVIKETDGSDTLIKKAEEILSAIEQLQTTLTEATGKYESALKLYDEKKYKDANESVEKLAKTDLSHPYLQSIKKDVEELQKNIKKAIAEDVAAKEKAEKEAAERKAAEQAAAEQAKKQNGPNVKLTMDDAMNIVKSLGDWPSSTTYELNPTILEIDGNYYYGIYVNTHRDESLSSRVNYLIDANSGQVYDYSRGEFAPVG